MKIKNTMGILGFLWMIAGAPIITINATPATNPQTLTTSAITANGLDTLSFYHIDDGTYLLHIHLENGFKIGGFKSKPDGYPTKITFPKNNKSYMITWPKTKVIELFPGYEDEGYEGSIWIPITTKKQHSNKSFLASVGVDMLLCSNTSCVPFTSDVGAVKTSMNTLQQNHSDDASFIKAKTALSNNTSPSNNNNFTWVSVGWMLIFAVLGGLILNIMPCVLPVLTLKIMKLLKTDKKEQTQIRIDFFQTSIGIIGSMLFLGLILLVIKLFGGAIGWGVHFQQPVFVGIMCAVLLYFTLSTCLDWPLINGQKIANLLPMKTKNGGKVAENILSGVLVTALSTPCTAPFLGSAVGFAIAAPSPVLLAIFFCIGLGLGLPYLMIAAIPSIARIMPKPGAWMAYIKPVFAFGFFLTAIWMFLILWKQLPEGWMGSWSTILLFVITCLGFLWVGWRQKRYSLMLMGVLGLFIASYLLPFRHDAITDSTVVEPMQFEQVLSDALAKNEVVFVDATAAWCLTCKWNKANVLDTTDIQQFFVKHNVRIITLDWTKKQDIITRYIHSFGRAGVPMNVVYGPSAKDGILLPELLSVDGVKKAVEDAR